MPDVGLAAPVFGRTAAIAVARAGAPALILAFPLPGPDEGHLWHIRSITVGGPSPAIVPAGLASIYVLRGRAAQPSLAALGMADCRDIRLMPSATPRYGEGEMTLRAGEQVFVVITGGSPPGQQYVAAVSFEDYAELPIGEEWSL